MNDPLKAALLYDLAIIQAKGKSSKINFDYTRAQLLAILFEKSIVKVKKEIVQENKAKGESVSKRQKTTHM